MTQPLPFDPQCRRCPRLVAHLDAVKAQHPDYHCAPVAPFGDPETRLLIVGLAPGTHGANATGRPFTGDFAGILLYRTLFEYGFTNRPDSKAVDDGLRLRHCRITNAVKCLPPDNKPVRDEILRCNEFLAGELNVVPAGGVVLSLGQIAHKAILRALGLRQVDYPFAHGRTYALPGQRHLVASYHCSRYNTQTGRLTETMFKEVFATIETRFTGLAAG